jgi:hypothetical protein
VVEVILALLGVALAVPGEPRVHVGTELGGSVRYGYLGDIGTVAHAEWVFPVPVSLGVAVGAVISNWGRASRGTFRLQLRIGYALERDRLGLGLYFAPELPEAHWEPGDGWWLGEPDLGLLPVLRFRASERLWLFAHGTLRWHQDPRWIGSLTVGVTVPLE